MKPKASAIDVKEQDSKGKAESGGDGWTVGGKQKPAPKSKISEGKGKAGFAASKIAAGNQKPSPAPKLKNPEVENQEQRQGQSRYRHCRQDRGRQSEPVPPAKAENSRSK